MSLLKFVVVSLMCSCILLRSFSLYCYTTVGLYIYLLNIRAVSNFGNHEKNYCEHMYTILFVGICFQFSSINIYEWNRSQHNFMLCFIKIEKLFSSIILQSHKQGMTIPLARHPCQYLLFLVYLKFLPIYLV